MTGQSINNTVVYRAALSLLLLTAVVAIFTWYHFLHSPSYGGALLFVIQSSLLLIQYKIMEKHEGTKTLECDKLYINIPKGDGLNIILVLSMLPYTWFLLAFIIFICGDGAFIK